MFNFFKKTQTAMPVNQSANQPTDEELKQILTDAENDGRRLGVLIASLDVADEVKQAILDILPQFTPEQLQRFLAILEVQYANQKTGKIDEEFAKELETIKTTHDAAIATATATAQKELEKLEKEINKMSD
ncbi:MAG: hypothetical protein US58_C0001G0028 [Candidatus Magasanikbacteria bacterium GW2011_GWA2_37_8]|uniref:Uncharacterized protein n=1 Tax=Candidatus Magasanikbacteria bacterium GW2011_GWA2_37_8 TaxID=1619036 RepID=A0A0G0JWV7_9BACT|nr:MAG: hypothetical protein US58_C0001G0028 [Candidatus Magasanikbacteria bacterium GW2011_GWA2_37_8]